MPSLHGIPLSPFWFYDPPDLKCETYFDVWYMYQRSLLKPASRNLPGIIDHPNTSERQSSQNLFGRVSSPIIFNVVGHFPCWQWGKPWLIYEWQYNGEKRGRWPLYYSAAVAACCNITKDFSLCLFFISKYFETQWWLKHESLVSTWADHILEHSLTIW